MDYLDRDGQKVEVKGDYRRLFVDHVALPYSSVYNGWTVLKHHNRRCPFVDGYADTCDCSRWKAYLTKQLSKAVKS